MTDRIVDMALSARTVADVVNLERALSQALPGVKERDLGDIEVNWSSVSSAGEPPALLMERVTNMFDALILDAVRDHEDRPWETPQAAVAALFDGGDDGMLRANAADATVVLFDSDDSRRTPTIAFHDKGIGLTPAEMPNTILSLHGSNKLDTPYLHGVFGKGGSSTSQYSDATVIVTRKQPRLLSAGEEDRVSVAVVRLIDTEQRRLEYFRYLVDGNRQVYSVPAAGIDFGPGTYVGHVNYHGDKIGQQNWEYEESIYAYAETILFKPTLPYQLRDARTGDSNVRPAGRQAASTLSGLAGRLERTESGKIMDRSDWTQIQVPGVGPVRMRWWLFENVDRRRRRAAKGYVTLFTTNGQVHHSWDQAKTIQLVPDKQRVAKCILVEVDCDQLGLKKRARIFDTFRTQTRRSPEAKALEGAVVDSLKDDPELIQYEKEFVSAALKSPGKGLSEAFLRKLNQAISIKTAGVAPIKPVPGPVDPQPPPAPADDLYPEPTYLSGPEVVSALLGKRSSIYLRTNAFDGFIPNDARLNIKPEPGCPDLTFTIGDLRKGRLRIGIFVPADAALGAYTLDFTLRWTARGTEQEAVLPWTTKVDILNEIRPRPTSGKDPGPADKGSIAFIWSDSKEQGWDDRVAGRLLQMPGSFLAESEPTLYSSLRKIQSVPTVVLNDDFREWSAYRQRIVNAKSDATAGERKERYGVAVGAAVAVIGSHENDLASKEETRERELSAGERAMTLEQQDRAIAQAARTAIVLFKDYDIIFGT